MRAAEHAPRDRFYLLERRHGLAEIVERGTVVSVERHRVNLPHSREDWNELLQRVHAEGPAGVLGFGEDFPADVAVEMRIADFVLEGPAAIGLKRTDPEGVPQRQYTSDADYDSASGAEEHEEAAAATASPTTHST